MITSWRMLFAADSSLGHRVSIESTLFEEEEGQMDNDCDVLVDNDHQMIDVGVVESDVDGSSEGDGSSSVTEDSAEDSEDGSGDEDDSEDDSVSDAGDSDDDDPMLENAEESDEFVENGIDLEYGDDVLSEENEFEGDENEGDVRADGLLEEGWTRIETGGFGGLLGRRSNAGIQNTTAVGCGRGLIDAAEAMIGQLLRSGEIPAKSLAEIEGTRGIRIVQPKHNQVNTF
jgi:hypothetical protein